MGTALYHADGTHYGTFCALYPHAHREDAGEVALLTLAGNMATHILDIASLRESERHARTLVEIAPVGACVVNEGGVFETVNDAFCAQFGYSRAELIGREYTITVPDGARDASVASLSQFLAAGGTGKGEVDVVCKDGEQRTVLAQAATFVGMDGHRRVAIYVTDITLQKAETRRHAFAARHDALTGLPNRSGLDEAIMDARSQKGDATFAILYLDLDRFKAVNDRLGHAAGDDVLREVACRLREGVRANDVVARLGGDEFAVLLRGVTTREAAETIAADLITALSAPFAVEGRAVTISASVGVAFAAHDAEAATDLLHAADMAMYAAKRGQG